MYGFLLLFKSNLSVSRGSEKVFEIFDIKNAVTLKTGIKVRDGHWKCHHSIERIWLPINGNHGPISYSFLDKRRFRSKIAIFSHPVYFAPPMKGFPLELGIGAGDQKTRVMGLPGGERTIFPAVWIEYTNYVTDGRTDTGRHDRAYA